MDIAITLQRLGFERHSTPDGFAGYHKTALANAVHVFIIPENAQDFTHIFQKVRCIYYSRSYKKLKECTHESLAEALGAVSHVNCSDFLC